MRFVIGILLLLCLISCDPQKPLVEYSDEQLINILMDVQIANTAVVNSSKKIQDSLRLVYRDQVSSIHKITPDELDTIIQNIHLDLPRFEVITDSVHRRIQRLEEYK